MTELSPDSRDVVLAVLGNLRRPSEGTLVVPNAKIWNRMIQPAIEDETIFG